MRIVIDPKCNFDQNMFQLVGEQIGEMLKPAYDAGNWYLFSKTLFDSGFVVGCEKVITEVLAKPLTTTELNSSTKAFEHLCCLQRGLIPLFHAFKAWDLSRDARYFSFLLNRESTKFEDIIKNCLVDLTIFTAWITKKGGSGEYLRKSSSKIMKDIDRIERAHGPHACALHGYLATCSYKSLLEHWLMPELNKRVESRKSKPLAGLREPKQADRFTHVKTDSITAYCDAGW